MMQPTSNHTTSNGRAPNPDGLQSRLAIRDVGGHVDGQLHAWIEERLARQLSKYATHIERIDVRFEDVNGPKGGIDRGCMIHLVLSALPPVVIETRAESDRAAFDLAAGRAERAAKRSMQKHGFSTNHKRRQRAAQPEPQLDLPQVDQPGDTQDALRDAGSSRGPRNDRRAAQLPAAHTRLARMPDDAGSDGAAEASHTATRNVKRDSAGMIHALEDSTTGQPSRKSTRGGANRVKPATPLTLRTKSQVHSPQNQARRG